jgi:hypothetical protein
VLPFYQKGKNMIKIILSLAVLGFANHAFCDTTATGGDGAGVTSPSAPCKEEIKCSENGQDMDDDYIIKQVEKSGSCSKAAEAVENCGFGSSKDNATTGAAIQVCDKESGKMSGADKSMRAAMTKRCEKVCNPRKEGTLCQSSISFCKLNVAKFMNGVARRSQRL